MSDATNPYNSANSFITNYPKLVAEQPNRANPSLDRASSAMSASSRTGERHSLPKQGTLFPAPIQLFAVTGAQFPSGAFCSTAPGATLHWTEFQRAHAAATNALSKLFEPQSSPTGSYPGVEPSAFRASRLDQKQALLASVGSKIPSHYSLTRPNAQNTNSANANLQARFDARKKQSHGASQAKRHQWKESSQHHSNTVHRQSIPKMSSAKSSSSQLEPPTNFASTYLSIQPYSTGEAFSSTGQHHSSRTKHPKHGHQCHNWQCEVCGKMFARSYDLICHLHTHTGEQPYNCKQCKRQFSFRSNLNRHIMRVHLNQIDFNCHLYDWYFFPIVDQDRGQKRHKTDGLTQSPTYTDDNKEDELVVENKETQADEDEVADGVLDNGSSKKNLTKV